MKIFKSLFPSFIIILLITACFDEPEFPNTPKIEFKDIYFREIGTNSNADSLVFTISFEDGDGDLGLSSAEIDSPYHEQDYFLDDQGKLITVRSQSDGEVPPPFESPYNCLNYIYDSLYIPESQQSVFDASYNVIDTFFSGNTRYYTLLDTFYIKKNPNHYNITVQFLEKQSDESFREFDWRTVYPYPQCGETFDGRFPILAKDDRKRALEGNITYALKSNGFLGLLSVKTLKLRIQIKDRALNLSNVVESGEFTLDKIKR